MTEQSLLEKIPHDQEIEALSRVISGTPYILITVVDEGVVDLTFAGFTPEQAAGGLRELADQLSEQLIAESVEDDGADDERQF